MIRFFFLSKVYLALSVAREFTMICRVASLIFVSIALLD
jgi:hypothetical protein